MAQQEDMGAIAADWFLRRQHRLAPAEEQEFSAWLAEHPAHEQLFQRMADGWIALDRLRDDPAMLDMRADAQAYAPRRAYHRWGVGLAACAVAAIGALSYQPAPMPSSPSVAVMATKQGQRISFAVSDGSHIMLDSASRVELRFSKDRRLIRLIDGQAYFQVAHDRTRPFVVDAGEREVVAIGTEFNVARSDQTIHVALTKGIVRVEPSEAVQRSYPGGPNVAVLAVGQALLYDRKSGETRIGPGDMATLTAWRTGQLRFDETPLRDAVASFNRYSSSPIRIADPRLADLPVSGLFRTDSAKSFVAALTHLFPIKAKQQDGAIFLTKAAAD